MVNAHGLSFGLKNEMLKMDQLPHTCDFEKYSTNGHETSFYTLHMSFGDCLGCQNSWH
jgi:hypothetical protein